MVMPRYVLNVNYRTIYLGRARESAGNGNRTRMASLEGWNFTIKLCPRVGIKLALPARDAKFFLALRKVDAAWDCVIRPPGCASNLPI